MSSKYDDLEKLADLKNKGIITEEEFIVKKNEILNIGNQAINKEPFPPKSTVQQNNASVIKTDLQNQIKPIETPALDSIKRDFDSIKIEKQENKPKLSVSDKILRIFIYLFVIPIVALVLIIFFGEMGSKTDRPSANTNTTTNKAPINNITLVPTEAPSVESQFVNTLTGYRENYLRAQNEIQKSDIFNEARAYENQFFQSIGYYIDNWKGEMRIISTNKGGSELNMRVQITMENKIKIYFDQESLDPSSSIYQATRNIKEGECVIFSGHIESKENSISEFGSMQAPEFAINFTNMSKCGFKAVKSQ